MSSLSIARARARVSIIAPNGALSSIYPLTARYNARDSPLRFRRNTRRQHRICRVNPIGEPIRAIQLTFNDAILRAYARIALLQLVALVVGTVSKVRRAGGIILRHLKDDGFVGAIATPPNASTDETAVAA